MMQHLKHQLVVGLFFFSLSQFYLFFLVSALTGLILRSKFMLELNLLQFLRFGFRMLQREVT